MAPWGVFDPRASLPHASGSRASRDGFEASREPNAPERKLPKSVPLAYIASFSTTSWPRLADSTNSGILSKFM